VYAIFVAPSTVTFGLSVCSNFVGVCVICTIALTGVVLTKKLYFLFEFYILSYGIFGFLMTPIFFFCGSVTLQKKSRYLTVLRKNWCNCCISKKIIIYTG